MEYIVFIHKNTDTLTTEAQWSSFFSPARKGGVFLGGSEISNKIQMGEKSVTNITKDVATEGDKFDVNVMKVAKDGTVIWSRNRALVIND